MAATHLSCAVTSPSSTFALLMSLDRSRTSETKMLMMVPPGVFLLEATVKWEAWKLGS